MPMLWLRRSPRLSDPASVQAKAKWLVLGLGNPGDKYASTRHNAGAWALEEISKELSAPLRLRPRDEMATSETDYLGSLVVLCFPQTFMNESGRVLSPIRKKYGAFEGSNILVIHDELDLEVGVVRVKSGGGLAGHNGLKSIAAHFGSNDFQRIRIGIGHPGDRNRVLNWVLSPPSKEDADLIRIGAKLAKDAALSLIGQGAEKTMGEFNARRP